MKRIPGILSQIESRNFREYRKLVARRRTIEIFAQPRNHRAVRSGNVRFYQIPKRFFRLDCKCLITCWRFLLFLGKRKEKKKSGRKRKPQSGINRNRKGPRTQVFFVLEAFLPDSPFFVRVSICGEIAVRPIRIDRTRPRARKSRRWKNGRTTCICCRITIQGLPSLRKL